MIAYGLYMQVKERSLRPCENVEPKAIDGRSHAANILATPSPAPPVKPRPDGTLTLKCKERTLC